MRGAIDTKYSMSVYSMFAVRMPLAWGVVACLCADAARGGSATYCKASLEPKTINHPTFWE